MTRIHARVIRAAAAATVMFLGGCASTSDTTGFCQSASICPLIVYEKYPGVFAVLPERMSISSAQPKNKVTLVWTFADQSKYKFSTKTDNIVDDGVELIGQNGAAIGLQPCFITNDSREGALYAPEGVYLRCEVTDGAAFESVRYRVRFHDVDGNPKVVDPRIDSSGGGDVRNRRAAAIKVTPPVYQFVPVNVGDPVHLPPIGTSDGVRVVWDAGAAGVFADADHPMIFNEDPGGAPVNFQPCRTTSDPKGETPNPTGRYFMCLITTAKPAIATTYTATYKDGGVTQVKSKTMTRP